MNPSPFRDIRRRELGGPDPLDLRLGIPPQTPAHLAAHTSLYAVRARACAVADPGCRLSSGRRSSWSARPGRALADAAQPARSRRDDRARGTGRARRHRPRTRNPLGDATVHRRQPREPGDDRRGHGRHDLFRAIHRPAARGAARRVRARARALRVGVVGDVGRSRFGASRGSRDARRRSRRRRCRLSSRRSGSAC